MMDISYYNLKNADPIYGLFINVNERDLAEAGGFKMSFVITGFQMIG